MKKTPFTISLLILSGTVLAGCSNFTNAFDHGGNPLTQPANYKKAQALQGNETTFKGALVKEYQMLSTKEGTIWSDWFDSDFFARKALEVAESPNGLPPEDPALWRFSKEDLVQFEPARNDLVSTLAQGHEKFPVLSAKAQARFDCWVEEQEEGWQNDEIAKCKGDFDTAMAELKQALASKPVDLAKLYTIFFDFDSSVITPVGEQVLQALIEDWGGKAVGLSLIGHTDSSGSAAYNDKLSLRRANAVKGFVTKLGMSSDKLQASGMGESSLAVPTQDGVREAKNRRVVIAVEE